MYFLGTGIVMRMLTPSAHFKNKSLTLFLRSKTQKNIHHFHLGLLLALVALFILFFNGMNKPILFFSAIGLSLIADEMFILHDFSTYFKKKGLVLSILGHVLIGGIITFVYIWFF